MRLIEPFAGYAAYSLRALWMAGGRVGRAEPPVSRMGSKAGFAPGVFRAWNLSRARWSAVLVNDLDPVCHLVHRVYADPVLRQAVARQIWAWVPCPVCLPGTVRDALEGRSKPTPESCKRAMPSGLIPVGDEPECCGGSGVRDARALWESIRSAPVPDDLVMAVASALFLQSRSFQLKPVTIEPSGWVEHGYSPDVSSKGVPVWSAVTNDVLADRLEQMPGAWGSMSWKPETDQYERLPTSHAAGDDSPRWTVADRLEALPGRWVSTSGGFTFNPEYRDRHGLETDDAQMPRWSLGERLDFVPGPGTCQIGVSRLDALEFVRGLELTSSDVLIVDPPYEDTTGYQATSARDAVIEIADRGNRAGALVLVHEAVGLADDLGTGWMQRSATALRSRRSGFWKDGIEREWLTANRPPSWWPAEQMGMFGGGTK